MSDGSKNGKYRLRKKNIKQPIRIASILYQAKKCDNCPLRGQCHQSKVDRRIEVNHRLNELKQKARTLLTSEKGLKHRSKRPIEAEAVFGQLKSNNKFNRFTFKGLEKVELEFLLMALGHNFRKMATKLTNCSNPINKTQKSNPNNIVKAIIYSLKDDENCFSLNFNHNPKPTKIAA